MHVDPRPRRARLTGAVCDPGTAIGAQNRLVLVLGLAMVLDDPHGKVVEAVRARNAGGSA